MSNPYGTPDGSPDPSQQPPSGQQPPAPDYGQPPSPYGAPPPAPYGAQPPAQYGGQPQAGYGGGQVAQPVSVLTVFLLGIVTFGIYLWFAQSRMNHEMAAYNPVIKRANVALSAWLLLACGFGSILFWIGIIENAGRIRQLQRSAGMPESCSTLGSIFGGWSQLYHQAKLNEVWTHLARSQGGQPATQY